MRRALAIISIVTASAISTSPVDAATKCDPKRQKCPAAIKYKNCTDLRKVHPRGVARDAAAAGATGATGGGAAGTAGSNETGATTRSMGKGPRVRTFQEPGQRIIAPDQGFGAAMPACARQNLPCARLDLPGGKPYDTLAA